MPYSEIGVLEMRNENYRKEDIPRLEVEIRKLLSEINGLGMKYVIARSIHGNVTRQLEILERKTNINRLYEELL